MLNSSTSEPALANGSWPTYQCEVKNYSTFMFVLYGVVLNGIVLFGLASNALSILVLSRRQMKSSINCCLLGLACCDLLVLGPSIFIYGLRYYCYHSQAMLPFNAILLPVISPYLLPVALTAQTGSIWLTVTVTVERFVAVCFPLRAKSLCTYQRARAAVVTVVAFAVVYNLPRFWELDAVPRLGARNETVSVSVEPSILSKGFVYSIVYATWMALFLFYLLPLTALAVLNTAIWLKVRQANKEWLKLTQSQRKEVGLTIMLCCVVTVFFLCNLLAPVNNILRLTGIRVPPEQIAVSNLLIVTNSSVNFVIYCAFGKNFRQVLVDILRSGCVGPIAKVLPMIKVKVRERNDINSNESEDTVC